MFIHDLIQKVEQKARDFVLGESILFLSLRFFDKPWQAMIFQKTKVLNVYICPSNFDAIKKEFQEVASEKGYKDIVIKKVKFMILADLS